MRKILIVLLLFAGLAQAEPPIRSITITDNQIQFVDYRGGTRTIAAASIPVAQNTAAKVETYLNTTWLPSVRGADYQIVIHVFSISPLKAAVLVTGVGVSVPANWWITQ